MCSKHVCTQMLFLWLEDCYVGLGKSVEQFTNLGVETVDDFSLVERDDLAKMGLHPNKIVAFFRKVRGIQSKSSAVTAQPALRVNTQKKNGYRYVDKVGDQRKHLDEPN